MDYLAQQQRIFFKREAQLKSFADEILETRRKISPKSYRSKTQPHRIDKQILNIIKYSTQSNPNRLSLLLKSKGFQMNSHKKGSSTITSHFQNRFFSQQYSKEQLKFIKSSQKQINSKERLKRKLQGFKIQGKAFHDLNKGSILYFEKKSIPQITMRGHYKEILHPLCGLYQKQAERTLRQRLKLADPFQQEQY